MSGTHFEVQADHGRGWSVQAVLDDLNAAKERAEDIKTATKAIAVKVLRVGYDERKSEFVEVQVHYVGEKRPDVVGKGDLLDAGPNCEKGKDLHALASRRVIKRVLKTWLEGVKVQPIELLHHAELIAKLDGAGTVLQGAVQRAAIAQAQQSGQSAQQRQRELYDVVDQAAAMIRPIWRDENRPKLTNDDIDALAASLPDDEDLTIFVALTERLQSCKSISEKLDTLMRMMMAVQSDRAVAVLDNFLTDFVEDGVFMRAVVGEQAQLGDALLRAIALLAGDDPSAIGAPEHFQAFIARLQAEQLPRCRKALVRRIVTTLASQQSLTNDGPLGEVAFNKKLASLLQQEKGGFLGGEEMHEAFLSRSERYVSANAIGKITEDLARPDERILAILNLVDGIFGERNVRRLGEYIVAIVEQPNNRRELAEDDQPPLTRMRCVASLQEKTLASRLPAFQIDKVSEILDEICAEIMDREKVLKRVVARASTPASGAVALLQLLGSGALTKGIASEQAQALAQKALRTPGLIEAVLADAKDADDKKRRLLEFYQLIEQADLPASPASAALAAAVG